MEECKEEIHDMQPLTKDYRYLLRKDPSDDTEETVLPVLRELSAVHPLLTEEEWTALLSRIQTLAQQFLDHRTASGQFYITLAQYPFFYEWLTDNAGIIYTECLHPMDEQYAFYQQLEKDKTMKERMDRLMEQYIGGMEYTSLQAWLKVLEEQHDRIGAEDYAQGKYGCCIIRAAQKNVNDHLRRLTDFCPFEAFRRLPHEQQTEMVHRMQAYSAVSERIREIILRCAGGISMNVLNRIYDLRFSQLQLKMYHPYYLEASIYYDAVKGQYNFSVIRNEKAFFSRHYRNISPRTLKYAAYAITLYVDTDGGDYGHYIRNTFETNKVLSKEDKHLLRAYLLWLLQDFRNRTAADEQSSDDGMRKICRVFECISQYVNPIYMTRDDLYDILYRYVPELLSGLTVSEDTSDFMIGYIRYGTMKTDTLSSMPAQSQETLSGTAPERFDTAESGKPAAISAPVPEGITLTQEDKAFLQWKHLSSSENIRRFRVCIQNHSFDEATQRLWDEWLSLYGRMPACLREFIADAEINGYIHEKAEQSMQE